MFFLVDGSLVPVTSTPERPVPSVPTGNSSVTSVGVASGELPNFDEMNTRAVLNIAVSLSSRTRRNLNASVRSTDTIDYEETEKKFKAEKALFQANN